MAVSDSLRRVVDVCEGVGYEPHRDLLIVGGARFSRELLIRELARLGEEWAGPLWLRRVGDEVEVTTDPANSGERRGAR